jgi:hypothetical protein
MLCTTLGRNPVPVVTITDDISTYISHTEEYHIQKLPNVIKKAYK